MPVRHEPLILAVDIGTSSVRTALFDAGLRRLPGSLAQRAHAVTHAADGAAELDPATLETGLHACLEHTAARAGQRLVTAIGVSCFWHGLLGGDARGKALTPIYTWADGRCREDAAALRAERSEKEYHQRTGCMLRASFWPAKLRWLARTRPGLFRRTACWQSPADWLQGHFCEGGGDMTGHGMATGTGLYDPNTLAWDPASIRLAGLRAEQLPTIGLDAFPLRAALRRRYPALREARWWPALGDGAAGNLGSGATGPGRAAINVGTSAAFRVMRHGSRAKSPFGLFCYRVDRERFLVGGAVSNAGNLRAWCLRELNLPAGEKALDAALAARPEPLRSLVVLPFWSAERAPTWCENVGGVVTGLSQDTTALDLLQATTEAVHQRLALIADLSVGKVESVRARGEREAGLKIIVSGGILKSSSLLQRMADVLGRPLCRCAEPEASLRGAAVYAAEREGMEVESAVGTRTLFGDGVAPRHRMAALYAQERRRQQRLEKLMGSAP